MTKLAIQKIEPIGTRKTYAHVNHADPSKHGFQWIDWPVFPPEHEVAGSRLRKARVDLDMGLREASRLLGLTPTELSGIERGEYYTCDVDEAIARLRDERETCPDCNGSGSERDEGGEIDACGPCGGKGWTS
jgi:hypothetical protein